MADPKVPYREVAAYLKEYKENNGKFPSASKTAKHFGVTRVTVYSWWKRIDEKGFLDKEEIEENLEKTPLSPMMYPDRTEDILKFLKEYHELNGFMPAAQEVADYFGVSTPVIFKNYKRMEQLGMIERRARISRGIRIL